MATTRRRATDEAAELELPPPPLEEVFELAGETGAKLYLYRVEPRTQNQREESYLARYDGRAPTADEVREGFGGGTFRLRLRQGTQWMQSHVFSIEGSPRFIQGERSAPGAATGAAPAASSGGDDRLSRLESAVHDLAATLNGGGGLSREEERDRREFRRLLQQQMILRAFSKDGRRNDDPIETFERMLSTFDRVLQSRGSDSGESPPWLPALESIMDRISPEPGAGAGSERANPPVGKSAAHPLPASGDDATRMVSFLEHIVRAARADNEPENLATWALQLLPAHLRAQLPTMTAGPWLRLFLSFSEAVPALRDPPVQEWLLRFLKALRAELLRSRGPHDPGPPDDVPTVTVEDDD